MRYPLPCGAIRSSHYEQYTCAGDAEGFHVVVAEDAYSARALRLPPDSAKHSYLVGLAPGCGLSVPSRARHYTGLQQF